DFAERAQRRGALLRGPLIAAAAAAALLLVALRVDGVRMRYALAHALEQERQLELTQRELTVEVQRLRDPMRLSREADRLGFVRPEALVDLPDGTGFLERPSAPARPPSRVANAGGRP
ncbi:MAG: hypothetical protein MJE66_21415, partial [Proteobacteria bacterium]|nr:hypothetical protein [Pseudomonadota bacterium]